MLLNTPREVMVGKKRCLCTTQNEILDLINKWKDKTACYISLYRFKKVETKNNKLRPIYDSAVANKGYFDFDNGTKEEDKDKLHNYFLKHDIKHFIRLSGEGYHILPLINPNLINPKRALYKFHIHLIGKLNIKVQHDHLHVYKNLLHRVFRVVDTKNFDNGCYCINLKKDEIKLPYDEHLKIAKKPRGLTIQFIGNKIFDISNFDEPLQTIQQPVKHFNFTNDDNEFRKEFVDSINIKSQFLPIAKILSNGRQGHRDRFMVVTYCKDILCLSERETAYFLYNNLNGNKYKHMIEELPSLKYGEITKIYNDGMGFSSCGSLVEEGYCGWDDCVKCARGKL